MMSNWCIFIEHEHLGSLTDRIIDGPDPLSTGSRRNESHPQQVDMDLIGKVYALDRNRGPKLEMKIDKVQTITVYGGLLLFLLFLYGEESRTRGLELNS